MTPTPPEEAFVAKPVSSQIEHMAYKTGMPNNITKDQILEKMHEMRLQTFEERINDPMNVKPYLPMLSSDEKEVIMEQYYASKKKLNKVIKQNWNEVYDIINNYSIHLSWQAVIIFYDFFFYSS